MVTTLFDIVKRLLNEVREFVHKPITIPFISELYRFITSPAPGKPGDQLTVASLGALLVAVPTSILAAATGSSSRARATRSDDGLRLGVAAGVGKLVVGAAFVAVSEAIAGWFEGAPNPVRVVCLAINLFVVKGLDIASDVLETLGDAKQIAVAVVFWALGETAVLLDLVDASSSVKATRYVAIFGGFGMSILMITTLCAASHEGVFKWDNTTHVYRYLDGFSEFATLVARFCLIGGVETGWVYWTGVTLSCGLTLAGGLFKLLETTEAGSVA